MVIAQCPECDLMTKVNSSPKLGQTIKCQHCGIELEVVWLDPLELCTPYDPGSDDEDYAYEDSDSD